MKIGHMIAAIIVILTLISFLFINKVNLIPIENAKTPKQNYLLYKIDYKRAVQYVLEKVTGKDEEGQIYLPEDLKLLSSGGNVRFFVRNNNIYIIFFGSGNVIHKNGLFYSKDGFKFDEYLGAKVVWEKIDNEWYVFSI